jgi:hypothetical protein
MSRALYLLFIDHPTALTLNEEEAALAVHSPHHMQRHVELTQERSTLASSLRR